MTTENGDKTATCTVTVTKSNPPKSGYFDLAIFATIAVFVVAVSLVVILKKRSIL